MEEKKNLINALIRDMQALKNLSQNLSLALDGFYESICKIVLDYYDVWLEYISISPIHMLVDTLVFQRL